MNINEDRRTLIYVYKKIINTLLIQNHTYGK